MLRNWSLNPLAKVAIGILRSYGADAHIYLPGVGTVNGITAGNYLDSAGTTAASVDNPVGLSLDALQAMTLGSERVTNGDFAAGTTGFASAGIAASTMSVVAGEAQLIPTVGYGRQIQAITCISGQTYRIGCNARVISGGCRAFLGITTSSAGASATTIGNTLSSTQVPLSGLFVASATTMYLVFGDDLNVAGGTLGFDDISIKQVPGIHATQATTANKPMLRRGLLNQLLYSQDLSNAVWSKQRVGFTTGQIGPDGSTTATLIYPNLSGSFPGVYQNTTRASSGVDSTTFRLKAAGFSWVVIISASGNASFAAWFNLTTGVKGSVAGGIASSIVPVSNGFYDCTITSPASTNPLAQFAVVDGDGSTTGTASGTNGVIVSIAGLFQGTYTAQQILDAGGIPLTTTAAASSTTGKYSWQFDGSNDSLSLSAPLFQMSDDHAVIVGANCASVTGLTQVIVTPAYANASDYVAVIGSDTTGKPFVEWNAATGGIQRITGPSVIVGSAFVASAIKVTNAKRLRINGANISTNSTAMVASTTATLGFIGSYAYGALYFQGSIYPVIAIKGTVSESDVVVLEDFIGLLSGVSL